MAWPSQPMARAAAQASARDANRFAGALCAGEQRAASAGNPGCRGFGSSSPSNAAAASGGGSCLDSLTLAGALMTLGNADRRAAPDFGLRQT